MKDYIPQIVDELEATMLESMKLNNGLSAGFLVMADDAKKAIDLSFLFDSNDPERKYFQAAMAALCLMVATDSRHSRLKRELFLKKYAAPSPWIGPLRIYDLKNRDTLLIGINVWLGENNEEEKDKPVRERENKKDALLIMAFERGKESLAFSRVAFVKKEEDTYVVEKRDDSEGRKFEGAVASGLQKILDDFANEDIIQMICEQHATTDITLH
jgi:hypothetical protein